MADLLRGLDPRLQGAVDLLVFNPPYVPTDPEELRRDGLARAWAGGARGREVVDRLLPGVARLLAPGGRFYLIALPQNGPAEILDALRAQGLVADEVGTRRADEEVRGAAHVKACRNSSKYLFRRPPACHDEFLAPCLVTPAGQLLLDYPIGCILACGSFPESPRIFPAATPSLLPRGQDLRVLRGCKPWG